MMIISNVMIKPEQYEESDVDGIEGGGLRVIGRKTILAVHNSAF